MYVITFYSYKGGAGRSMALINVGMHFVKQGKRVLFVDFDLEAPGLGSYEGAGRLNESRGVVEYVREYLDTGAAPDVNGYISRGSVSGPGEAWFMGAGRQDDGYAGRLGSIDWMGLYSESDGFLLFEDLRRQWNEALSPDYVLIDSRTGFTDTGGICTRQLPDAVCFVAFPTDQNLVGLEPIVRAVRQDAVKLPGRARDLHLVISNVPKLDDENDILATSVQRFRERLGFAESPAIIHHYHSLSLLRQTVFVNDRPNSELTKAYVGLANRLAIRNVADRDAALTRLQGWFAADPSQPGGDTTDSVLRAAEEIRKEHEDDGEVLFWLARVHRRWGDIGQALALLETALANDYREPTALSEQVLLLFLAGQLEDAKSHLRSLLETNVRMGLLDIERLIQLGRRLGAEMDLAQSELVRAASPRDRIDIAKSAMRHGMYLGADSLAEALLVEGTLTSVDAQCVRDLRGEIAIQRGDLDRAITLMNPQGAPSTEHTPATAYNLAVASYWLGRSDAADWMQRGLMYADDVTSGDPASAQCKAFGLFVCQQPEAALDRLRSAQQRARRFPFASFSVWRYRLASQKEFLADCDALQALINGESVRPNFLLSHLGRPRD